MNEPLSSDTGKLSSTPETKEEEEKRLAYERNKDFDYKTLLLVKQLLAVGLTFGALVLCFIYCKLCLLGVVVGSACLCPYMPALNLPLWTALLMLIVFGWHATNGVFSMGWSGLGLPGISM